MSKEYDPIMCGKVLSIPEGHTIYDKILVAGPLTVDALVEQLKHRFNIDVSMISSGRTLVYN